VGVTPSMRPTAGAPPALLLGGQENTLAITRSLSRRGVRVAVSARSRCLALRSRFCWKRFPVPERASSADHWRRLLVTYPPPELEGCVILACNDDAIEFIASEGSALAGRYVLEEHVPSLRRALLDKQRTLELAREAGVPAPRFWEAASLVDVERLAPEVQFPAMIKPVHSHRFYQLFEGRKYLPARGMDDLLAGARAVLARGLPFLVCELVPGPDRLLSSYYTYIDERGEALFRFTKSVIRRQPVNMGGGCYHVTEWLPETAAIGERFFRSIGLRGLGNVEFKRDPRDGLLKLIESNARFTAAHELLVRAGMDTAAIVYDHLLGRPVAPPRRCRQGLRLWYPRQDFGAFREMRRRGELTFAGWIRSIARRQVLPYFSVRDPWPSLVNSGRYLQQRLLRMLGRSGATTTSLGRPNAPARP